MPDVLSPALSLGVITLDPNRNTFLSGQSAIINGQAITVPPKINGVLNWVGSTIDLASQGLDIYKSIVNVIKPPSLTTVTPQTIAVKVVSSPTPVVGNAAQVPAGTNTTVVTPAAQAAATGQGLSMQTIIIILGIGLLIFLLMRR